MAFLTTGDILGISVGIAGLLSGLYFYLKSKKHKDTIAARQETHLTKIEGSVTETQIKLSNIEVSLTQYRAQERVENYPDIKKESNLLRALEAFLAFVLIIVLIKVISDYISGKRASVEEYEE